MRDLLPQTFLPPPVTSTTSTTTRSSPQTGLEQNKSSAIAEQTHEKLSADKKTSREETIKNLKDDFIDDMELEEIISSEEKDQLEHEGLNNSR